MTTPKSSLTIRLALMPAGVSARAHVLDITIQKIQIGRAITFGLGAQTLPLTRRETPG